VVSSVSISEYTNASGLEPLNGLPTHLSGLLRKWFALGT